jgi:hypothetical protein
LKKHRYTEFHIDSPSLLQYPQVEGRNAKVLPPSASGTYNPAEAVERAMEGVPEGEEEEGGEGGEEAPAA